MAKVISEKNTNSICIKEWILSDLQTSLATRYAVGCCIIAIRNKVFLTNNVPQTITESETVNFVDFCWYWSPNIFITICHIACKNKSTSSMVLVSIPLGYKQEIWRSITLRHSSLLNAQAAVSIERCRTADFPSQMLRPHYWRSFQFTLAACAGANSIQNRCADIQSPPRQRTTVSGAAHLYCWCPWSKSAAFCRN